MPPEIIIRKALERYERPLVAYARSITGEIESARDAVQETFLRLSRQDNLSSLEPRIAPWLFFVCRNCALDHCRKVVPFASENIDQEYPDGSASPDAAASSAEDRVRLRQLLEQLPPKQRELLSLKFDGGLSYKEMSDTTRLSVSNVGYQLHHAIQTLRTLWNQHQREVLP